MKKPWLGPRSGERSNSKRNVLFTDDHRARSISPRRNDIRSRSPTLGPHKSEITHTNQEGILRRSSFLTRVVEGSAERRRYSRTTYLSNIGSVTETYKRNSIIDGGAPYSTTGLEEVCELCYALSIDVRIDHPRMGYQHGWGKLCSEPRTAVGTWYLHTLDSNGNPTIIPFDVLPGRSPMIIGLELEGYSNTISLSKTNTVTFERPNIDSKARIFYIYHAEDETGCDRKW